MKHGKKYVDSFKAIDKAKQYDAPEALELAAKGAKAKFDETIELPISRMIRIASLNRPDLSPFKPARFPAMLKS